MCHTPDYPHPSFHFHNHNRLKLTNFTVALTLSTSHLPEFLTLVFLHRNDGTPTFLTLHPTPSPSPSPSSSSPTLSYASHARISFSHGLVFEVLLGELSLLKGVFRVDHTLGLRLHCRCAVDETRFAGVKLKHLEMRVGEDDVRVLMMTRKGFKLGLVDIPEETHHDTCVDDVDDENMIGTQVEGVKWAVDVGIWVGCLGLALGFMLSTASVKSFKRRNLLPL
ncbi:hypothetical protein vseg_004883 [Gypsophila vaccaria]